MKHTGNLKKTIEEKEGYIKGLTEDKGNLEGNIAEKEDHINNLEYSIRERDTQIFYLKDFETKVKSTFLYRIYRSLRLDRIYK